MKTAEEWALDVIGATTPFGRTDGEQRTRDTVEVIRRIQAEDIEEAARVCDALARCFEADAPDARERYGDDHADRLEAKAEAMRDAAAALRTRKP